MPAEPGLPIAGDATLQAGSVGSVTSGQTQSPNMPLPSPGQSAPLPDHELSIVIPAYNEAARLPRTLDSLSRYLENWGVDHRVFVVDDGSQDATASLGEGHGDRVSVIRQPNRGKGAAVRNGMLHATGRIVAFTDADLPYHLKSLRLGYERIRSGEFEVAFGARDLAESNDVAKRPLARRAAHTAFRLAVRLLLGTQIHDTQFGLKLFSRNAAIEIFGRGTVDGFAFDAEVIYLTQALKFRHCRIPVTLLNDSESSISLTRHSLPMLLDVMQLRLRSMAGGYNLKERPLRDRVPEPTAACTTSSSGDNVRSAA